MDASGRKGHTGKSQRLIFKRGHYSVYLQCDRHYYTVVNTAVKGRHIHTSGRHSACKICLGAHKGDVTYLTESERVNMVYLIGGRRYEQPSRNNE